MRTLKKFKPTRFKAPDAKYNKSAADYAVNFIECLSHTKGTWSGKPFELIDWQEQIIRDLFGILKPNGYRQFNTAYIEIPKKWERVSLPLPSLFSCAAAMARNERKYTAAQATVSKPLSSLRSQRIWFGCVPRLASA